MSAKPDRPNILFILPDRLPYKAIGPGSPCRIPNLKKLMENGVCFENTYTTTPLCTPARASMLTGLYPHGHKLTHNTHTPAYFVPNLPRELPTLGEILHESGYVTRYVGKWHVGQDPPTERGFETWQPVELHTEEELKDVTDSVNFFEDWGNKPLSGRSSVGPEDTEAFRSAGIVNGLLEEYAETGRENPFFIFASTVSPHSPWIVPEPYASMYNPEDLKPWDNFSDDRADKPLAFHKAFMFHHQCRIDHDWETFSRALAKLYGVVSLVDAAFGSIVSKLEELRLRDDTVIVFVSDHGELLGDHGLIGMAETMCEELVHVPLVVSWPDRFKPAARTELISGCDLFNTILELSGCERPTAGKTDGRSLVPLLKGESTRWRESVLSEHHGSGHLNLVRMMRKGPYKYVFRANELDELYDLEKDPGEMVNRIDNADYDAILWDMKETLIDVLVETSDAFVSTPLYTFCRDVIESKTLTPSDKDVKRERFNAIRRDLMGGRAPHGQF